MTTPIACTLVLRTGPKGRQHYSMRRCQDDVHVWCWTGESGSAPPADVACQCGRYPQPPVIKDGGETA